MVRSLAIAACCLASSMLCAAPGGPNPGFGIGGKVVTSITPPQPSAGNALAIQADGRIVVAGTSSDGTKGLFALARYNRDGSLDTSFGTGGKVTTQMPGPAAVRAVAIQADGKIVAAGGDDACRVVRYTASGGLDGTFGSGGVATPASCTSTNGVAIDASGRIVLAGTAGFNFVVLRLTPTGAPDTTFNSTGSVSVGSGTGSIVHRGRAVAIAADGKIVAAGYTFVAGLGLNSASLRIARLSGIDGSFDTSFNGTGVVSMNVSTQASPPNGPQDFAYALALQAGGEIVVAGSASPTTGPGHFLVARFTSAGALDPSFNGTGFATTTIGTSTSVATGVAIQSNGKILAAGISFNGSVEEFAFVRYLNTGALDSSFGTGGRVTVGFTGAASASGLAVESGGAIFAAGNADNGAGMSFAVVGLEGDDTTPPDTFFTSTPASIITGPDTGYTFAATDLGGSGLAGFDCRLDAAAFAPCTSPVTLTGLSQGTHTFRVRARDNAGNVEQAPAAHTIEVTPLASTPRLANISTRGQVQAGFDVMIGGFVISGNAPKTVLVRAVGPSLANYGVEGALANPRLQLVRQSDQVVIAENDDWIDSADAAAIDASGLAPRDIRESAIRKALPPGAYTAIVTGVGGATGVGLVEVYELDQPEVALINLSTRGKVETGFDVMIGGFIIQGSGPQTVVIRAIGPSLANYGVPGSLQDPTLQLVRLSDGATIAFNNDWGTSSNAGQIQASGLAPLHPYESAILITLDPGAYTAIVAGLNGGTGVGLVEVFKR